MSSEDGDGTPLPVPIITNTDWQTANNTMSLDPILPVNPTCHESHASGGTSGILEEFAKYASISPEHLMYFLDGGKKNTIRRKWIVSPTEGFDSLKKYNMTRAEHMASHLELFTKVHDKYVTRMIPTRQETSWMTQFSAHGGTLSNHWGLGVSTILLSASEDQMSEWLPASMTMKMTLAYAQTELGKGSNVRGLQTVAVYSHAKDCFVISTPTLKSIKWWPGTLGKVATHALVYAQLIIDKKEYGVHAFLVQIRDENHRPLKGVEVGVNGNTIGDFANDCGFLRLQNVCIPKFNMLARHQYIDEEGKYHTTKAKKDNPRLHYLTMMMTRGSMILQSGGVLAKAVVTAIRYSFLRCQGFLDPSTKEYIQSNKTPIEHIQKANAELKSYDALKACLSGDHFTQNGITPEFGKIMLETAKPIGLILQPSEENARRIMELIPSPDLTDAGGRTDATEPTSAEGSTPYSFLQPEYPIVEYPTHRYRLLKQLSICYLLKFTGKWMMSQLQAVEGESAFLNMENIGESTDVDQLRDIAATTGALKAICTVLASNGIEDMRKCVGGNGYLKHAGIGPIHLDYLWQTTAEGEEKVMILHTAKHILKHLETEIDEQAIQQYSWNETIKKPSLAYLDILRPTHGRSQKSEPHETPSFDYIFKKLGLDQHIPALKGIDYSDSTILIRIFQYRALCYWKLALDSYRSILNAANGSASEGTTNTLNTSPGHWTPSQEFAWTMNGVLFSKAVEHHARYMMVLLYFDGISAAQSHEEIQVRQLYPCLYRLGVFYVTSDFLDNEWIVTGASHTPLFHAIHMTQMQYLNNVMSYSLKYDLLALTQAFDIPDRVLASALGRADGHIYEALFTGALSAELNSADPYYGYNELIRARMDVDLLVEGKQSQYSLHDAVFGTAARL